MTRPRGDEDHGLTLHAQARLAERHGVVLDREARRHFANLALVRGTIQSRRREDGALRIAFLWGEASMFVVLDPARALVITVLDRTGGRLRPKVRHAPGCHKTRDKKIPKSARKWGK